jgi:hypothetical protein
MLLMCLGRGARDRGGWNTMPPGSAQDKRRRSSRDVYYRTVVVVGNRSHTSLGSLRHRDAAPIWRAGRQGRSPLHGEWSSPVRSVSRQQARNRLPCRRQAGAQPERIMNSPSVAYFGADTSEHARFATSSSLSRQSARIILRCSCQAQQALVVLSRLDPTERNAWRLRRPPFIAR